MSGDQQAELARKRAEIEEKRKNLERLRAEAAAKDRVGQLAELKRRKSDLLERKKDIAVRKAENEKALDVLQKSLTHEELDLPAITVEEPERAETSKPAEPEPAGNS